MNFSDEFKNFILENFNRKNYDDKSYLEEFRRLLVLGNSLENFVKSISCGNLGKHNGLAHYNHNNVIFDINNMKRHINYLIEIGELSPEFVKYFDFLVPQVLIHEIRHAYQDKICLDKEDNSSWVRSLRDSVHIHNGHLKLDSSKVTIDDELKGLRLYKQYNSLFPGERDAEMFSFSFMKDMYESFDPEDIIGNSDLSLLFYNIFSDGYAYNTCPLREFYKVTGNAQVFDSLDFSDYSLSERIIFGMPLSLEEFKDEKVKILGY